MIPKKIYLREADFDDLFTSERMVACDEPFNDLNVEYTDLSQIWHKRLCKNFMNGVLKTDL